MSRVPPDLAEYAAAGMSDPVIAQIFGVSARTVLRWRKSQGIASTWQPERFPCGTRASYWRGCRCDDCRAAIRPVGRARYAATSAQTTERFRSSQPWTAEDDEILLGPGSTVERARILGRSYAACLGRITDLRSADQHTGQV